MHHSTLVSFSENLGELSIKATLSGVVTRICGTFLSILALSATVVSPVLNPTLISISFPCFLAISSISFRGPFRFTSISLESALRGLT